MGINPIMASALRALSYADIDFTKAYKIERVVENVARTPIIKNFNMVHYHVERDGYTICVRIFEPDERKSDGVLLFFHGGGWVYSTIDTYTKTCATLSNMTGRRVASVDYRLAPENPFPCAIEDCYRVAREMHLNEDALFAGAEGITLVGDSAGGNIAAVVSQMAKDRGEFSVRRQILIYPATNNVHDERSPFPSIRENGRDYLLTSRRICDYTSLYLQNPEDYDNPYFAPLLAFDLTGQPRTLIVTAEYDPLRDEGEAYGEKLRKFGVDTTVYRMDNALHGFFMLPLLFTHVRKLYRQINAFLDKEADGDQ